MIRTSSLAALWLVAAASQALADPPADLDACLQLSTNTAKAAHVNTEAKYAKFHLRLMDLNAACGQQDFATAEKIADEIKATFPPEK